jgi:hypothetical protein
VRVDVKPLRNGVAYTFTATASNSVGNSAASAVSPTVIPVSSGGPPAPPLITAVDAADAAIVITFDAPTDDGGAAITGVQATVNPGGRRVAGVGSPLRIGGLANGTPYVIELAAVNEFGVGGAMLTPSTTPVGGVPFAPAAVSATSTGAAGAIAVAFSPPMFAGGSTVTSYAVVSSPGGRFAVGAASPLVVTGLRHGERYTFTATAKNAQGTSPSSSPTPPVVAVGPPTAPVVSGAVRGDRSATVRFAPPRSNGGAPILVSTANRIRVRFFLLAYLNAINLC